VGIQKGLPCPPLFPAFFSGRGPQHPAAEPVPFLNTVLTLLLCSSCTPVLSARALDMSGPNSLAYKLLWKGSEKFGSLVPAGGAAQTRGAPASTGGFDDEEEDDDAGASASASAARKRAATSQDIDDDEDEDEDEAPARRVHTTLTSDEDNDDDADVELVKAATEKVLSHSARFTQACKLNLLFVFAIHQSTLPGQGSPRQTKIRPAGLVRRQGPANAA
jgi:hypothetical protein